MNCMQCSELMMRHYDGTLNDIETAQMKQHLKICRQCGQDFEQLDELLNFLETDNTIIPPDDFTAQVMKRVEKYEALRKAKSAKWRMYLYNGIAIACTFLLIIYAAVYSGSFSRLGSILDALTGGTFRIVADVMRVLFETAALLVKYYSYIVVALLAMLLAVQRTFILLVERNKGGSV